MIYNRINVNCCRNHIPICMGCFFTVQWLSKAEVKKKLSPSENFSPYKSWMANWLAGLLLGGVESAGSLLEQIVEEHRHGAISKFNLALPLPVLPFVTARPHFLTHCVLFCSNLAGTFALRWCSKYWQLTLIAKTTMAIFDQYRIQWIVAENCGIWACYVVCSVVGSVMGCWAGDRGRTPYLPSVRSAITAPPLAEPSYYCAAIGGA